MDRRIGLQMLIRRDHFFDDGFNTVRVVIVGFLEVDDYRIVAGEPTGRRRGSSDNYGMEGGGGVVVLEGLFAGSAALRGWKGELRHRPSFLLLNGVDDNLLLARRHRRLWLLLVIFFDGDIAALLVVVRLLLVVVRLSVHHSTHWRGLWKTRVVAVVVEAALDVHLAGIKIYTVYQTSPWVGGWGVFSANSGGYLGSGAVWGVIGGYPGSGGIYTPRGDVCGVYLGARLRYD